MAVKIINNSTTIKPRTVSSSAISNIGTSNVPKYKGSYEVVPDTVEQTLATKDKLMTDNVKVKEIPVYSVSNTAGGTTFTMVRE